MEQKYILPIFAGVFCIVEQNGVMCRVSNKGGITLSSQKLKKKIVQHNYIFLRGLEYAFYSVLYFFYALHYSFVNASNQTVFKNKSLHKKNEIYFGGGIFLLAIFISIFLLGVIPNYIGFSLFSYNYNLMLKYFCIAVVKCVVFYLILLGISFLPEFKTLWKFNCAGNIISTGKKHRPLNFFNILISALLLTFFTTTFLSANVLFGWKILINLGIFIASLSIIFEVALLLEKQGGKWYNISSVVGVLTTAKPDKTELQVVQTALSEGILMEENKERELLAEQNDGSVSYAFVLGEVKTALNKQKMDFYGEAEWLIACVLKCKKMDLKFVKTITKNQYKEIIKAMDRRLMGEPIDKIFGFTEFYGLEIKVNKDVLTPRQDTEILVEQAIKLIENSKLSTVLDLCTGSGAIAISIEKNTKAKVFASDISEKALIVARKNAERLKSKIIFKQSDLLKKFKLKRFDLIVSNPPYIKTEDIAMLSKEVKNYDPILALDGGLDGYDFYKKIILEAPKHLSKKGYLLLEVGAKQAPKVKKLLTENFSNIKIIKDYGGVQRVLLAKKKVQNDRKNKNI